ncbi:hypothetical protein Tco_0128902 [Tanacetum coccineum]
MLLMQAQENGVELDEEQLLFLVGGQTNTFDADVDDRPTMFMGNLYSVDPVYDEACPLYDLDILSEILNIRLIVMLSLINNEQAAKCVANNAPNKAINVSLTAELARYKELAETYEQRAKFELTE